MGGAFEAFDLKARVYERCAPWRFILTFAPLPDVLHGA
jgi:hypothetical protein